MGVTRTWILPIIRIVIFLAIAAALVKIAFFPDPSTADAPAFPTGAITEPEVPVTLGSITNDVTITGSVVADDAVPVKSTLAGEVQKLLVAPGQPVAADTPVLTVRSETPGVINDDGTAARPVVRTVTVVAGSAGIVSSMPVIASQTVAVGEAVAQIAPTTFSVTGALAPEQQYRLLTRPTEAQVTITGGPAPFTCGGLTISSPLAGAASSESDPATPSSAAGATVRCAVPTEVTVFAGLAAELTLAGGVAENVLTVPVTAVEGASGVGNVYVMSAAGEPEAKPVSLGIGDGVNVQIIDGLEEGEMVLQFVPGAAQAGVDVGGGCTEYPDGVVECAG